METDAYRGAPFTVIIAEKEPIARATLAALLSCDGYRVFQAENLETAISCVDRLDDFQVFIADLAMAGWESLVQRVLSKTPDVFVIAMAANDSTHNTSDLEQYGIEAMLQKPISYNSVEQLLGKRFMPRRPPDLTSSRDFINA